MWVKIDAWDQREKVVLINSLARHSLARAQRTFTAFHEGRDWLHTLAQASIMERLLSLSLQLRNCAYLERKKYF